MTNQFRKFWDLGYKRLIPITVPGALVSERSSLFKRQKDVGKAPGVKGADGLFRGLDWIKHVTVETDLDEWHAMGCGVGLRLGAGLVCVDIDTLDEKLADVCARTATEILGASENRVGRSPRRAKLYRVSENTPYRRITFDGGAVELLTEGKQCVVAGIHPHTGKPFEWPRGVPMLSALPVVTPAQLSTYFVKLAERLPAAKVEVSTLATGGAAAQPAHLAGREEDVRKAVAALPNTTTLFPTYASYIEVAQAIKGALPDDPETGLELFQQWAAKWEGGNEPDRVAADWSRTHPSRSLGADYLFSLAERHSGSFAAADTWFTGAVAGLEPTPAGDQPAGAIATHATTEEEWGAARATRPAIVDNWFYEDIGHLAAPGGVGKTTLLLFQAVHVVLGRPLFGYKVRRPGPVIYLTAEDDRETMVARLRCMCAELGLTGDETRAVRESVRIIDVAGRGIKLTEVVYDVVRPSKTVGELVDLLGPLGGSLLFIDPLVSFGVGESRVNDAEQGLIDVARRFRADLRCGVHFVHHTGKQNARDKTLDQYTGRGGSALADGSRVTHVMQSLAPDEWHAKTGATLEEGASGLVYARPKLTWAPPNQPDLYIKRKGYTFTRVEGVSEARSEQASMERDADLMLSFLSDAAAGGVEYTRYSARDVRVCRNRPARLAAISYLIAAKRITEEPETRVSGQTGPTKLVLKVRSGALD